jgi:CBS domain containing-hemolysin-like protein
MTRVVRLVLALGALLLAFPGDAHASLMSPEVEDKIASFLAIFILFIVPIVLIVLFWMVHVLPEKIAHKRHHPQFEAIRTLCLLSLVFGGLLWPFAWIWAYSKPVMYKMAYGTDRHPDALHDGGEAWDTGTRALPAAGLSDRLARLEQRGVPESELRALRENLEKIEAKLGDEEAH